MIRRIIGATVLTGFVWFTFSVKLGSKTFAEHIQAINKTPEAQDLMKGMGSVVRPALDEAKERVLGEYIEAPTSVHRTRPSSSSNSKQRSQAKYAGAEDKKNQSSSNQARRKAPSNTEPATCSRETGKSKRGKKTKPTSPSQDTRTRSGKSPSSQGSLNAASRVAKGRDRSTSEKLGAKTKTKSGTQANAKVSRASSHSRKSSEKSARSSPPNEAERPEPG